MAAIGDRVRTAVSSARLRQKQLAERVGMTADSLYRVFDAQCGFAFVEYAAIAIGLDADVHELVTGALELHLLVVVGHDVVGGSASRESRGGSITPGPEQRLRRSASTRTSHAPSRSSAPSGSSDHHVPRCTGKHERARLSRTVVDHVDPFPSPVRRGKNGLGVRGTGPCRSPGADLDRSLHEGR